MNVTVRNVITSMRLISWFDWAQFVESVGLVDEVLRERSAFGEMDFATRDRYRNAIEELARGSGLTELEVARTAVAMAASAPAGDDVETAAAARRRDPGYYLIADGRAGARAGPRTSRCPCRAGCERAYVRSAATRLPRDARARHRAAPRRAAPARRGRAHHRRHCRRRDPRARPGVRPRRRPRQPDGHQDARPPAASRARPRRRRAAAMRTLVVVPMLLTDEADVEAQVGGLEVHYLANRDGDLRFALLSDWLDAPTEHVPGDDELLAAAAAAIDRLNERHGEAPGGGARFLLFHRERRWNEAEGRWMGWERKRGKLEELNALLRGSTTTGILTTGRTASTPPPDVRYVVTLDADTRLPRGAVGRLVGTIAHPLNQPTFDPGAGSGDPRLRRPPAAHHPDAPGRTRGDRSSSASSPARPASTRTPPPSPTSTRTCSGREASPARGSTTSTRSSAAMADRVPENTLLSHDLFEGIFARAGLVTDVELFDEYPSNYLVSAARQHRWARGDWQLLPWILGRARDATGRRSRSSIPGIARWKMVDNLRRTLSRPAHARDARRRLDAAVRVGRAVDGVRPRLRARPGGAARPRRPAAAPAGHLQAQPRASGRRGHRRSPRPTSVSASPSWPTRHG